MSLTDLNHKPKRQFMLLSSPLQTQDAVRQTGIIFGLLVPGEQCGTVKSCKSSQNKLKSSELSSNMRVLLVHWFRMNTKRRDFQQLLLTTQHLIQFRNHRTNKDPATTIQDDLWWQQLLTCFDPLCSFIKFVKGMSGTFIIVLLSLKFLIDQHHRDQHFRKRPNHSFVFTFLIDSISIYLTVQAVAEGKARANKGVHVTKIMNDGFSCHVLRDLVKTCLHMNCRQQTDLQEI